MARLKEPVEDFCSIKKKEIVEKTYKEKRKYIKSKNKVCIPRVISNYKNPKSELVPLKVRDKFNKPSSSIVAYDKFIEFNRCLDKVEEWCKNNKN